MKQIICDLCSEPIHTGSDLAEGKLGNRYEITVTRHIFMGIHETISQGRLDLHVHCRESLVDHANIKRLQTEPPARS